MTEKCAICGATENIQKHHTSYEPEVIQLLCVDCHKKVHNHGVGNPPGWNPKLFETLGIDAEILFKEGATNGEVAKACDVSYATASHWRKKLGFIGATQISEETKIRRLTQQLERREKQKIKEKTDKEMAQSFRIELMEKRGITETETYLVYLRKQKEIKLNASKARVKEAEQEIRVIELMLEGKI